MAFSIHPWTIHRRTIGLLLCVSLLAVPQLRADDDGTIVNCQQGASLARAVAQADPGDTLIIKGVCTGPITITTDGLTLNGLGSAILDGGGQNVVTINAAKQITLQGLEIRHGAYGLIANGVAQLTLKNVVAHHNAVSGMLIQDSSSVTLADSSATNNGLMGIDIEGSSSATFARNIVTSSNGVFGIDIGTGSNATFTQATVVIDHNVLGLQAGATSNVFISDPGTTITAHHNATIGVTVVSGSHLFDFGGRIICFNNGLSGVSVASRSGIDVDAAGSIVSYNNAGDGVLLQELALLNMFNTPQFSGAQGTSTVDTHQNAGNGITALGVSVVHMFNQAQILSKQNGAAGLHADDGSSLFVTKSTVTGNTASDILLTFGARADLTLNTIGRIKCDKTALIRGDTGVMCPHPH